MSSSSNNVIVFGAGGAVGRAAAISAAENGAKVWLAMRDPSKTIPYLSAADKKSAGFERIKADLLDPSSLKAAVTKSRASTAFVYMMASAKDSMKSAFETLKDSGITDVVLLSSYTVTPSAAVAKDLDYVSRVHALTELQLIESGLNYVTLRPAYFSSNMLWNTQGIKEGEVKLFKPEHLADFIAPEDIGAVAGALLTTPSARLPHNEINGKSIFLCGPKVMTIKEAVMIVGKILGKEIKIMEINESEFREAKKFLPQPVLEAIVENQKRNASSDHEYTDAFWLLASENVRKYARKEPMSFEEWVRVHKAEFE